MVPCIGISDGVSGSGVVQAADREVVRAVAATSQTLDTGETTTFGLLRWVDPNWQGTGLTLESNGIGAYGPVPGARATRELFGSVSANGEGHFPFVLRVFDAGSGASGEDTVALLVGDGVLEGGAPTGFAYAAEGTLIAGDLVGTWTLSSLATPTP